MSSNATGGSNTTNVTRVYTFNVPVIFHFYSGIEIFIAVVGTLLNLWFLVAILSSQDTRSRLRNKIICNSLVLHLVDSVFVMPFKIARFLARTWYTCLFRSSLLHIKLIQDFIGNWMLVMLLVVFIAQIEDFNPKMKLSPRTIILGTVGLLVFPWVASLVLVPVIVHEYFIRFARGRSPCSFATNDAMEVFRSVDTAVPVFLAVLLLLVAVFLRYRRFTRGEASSSMQTQLISGGPEIDSPLAYIVATVVSTICDILELITVLNARAVIELGYLTYVNVTGSAIMLSDARAILMPLPWLFLPDVRQRIKTWRPGYRCTRRTDLTVAYKREDS